MHKVFTLNRFCSAWIKAKTEAFEPN